MPIDRKRPTVTTPISASIGDRVAETQRGHDDERVRDEEEEGPERNCRAEEATTGLGVVLGRLHDRSEGGVVLPRVFDRGAEMRYPLRDPTLRPR